MGADIGWELQIPSTYRMLPHKGPIQASPLRPGRSKSNGGGKPRVLSGARTTPRGASPRTGPCPKLGRAIQQGGVALLRSGYSRRERAECAPRAGKSGQYYFASRLTCRDWAVRRQERPRPTEDTLLAFQRTTLGCC